MQSKPPSVYVASDPNMCGLCSVCGQFPLEACDHNLHTSLSRHMRSKSATNSRSRPPVIPLLSRGCLRSGLKASFKPPESSWWSTSSPLAKAWLDEISMVTISGAAALLRQSENIHDIVSAICSRSNRVLGFVHQHRVHSLMKGLCRTAISCNAGLNVGTQRIACNGLCTAARFHTAEENPGCILDCHEGFDCSRHYNRCPTLFDYFRSLWPGICECISPTAIFNELLFKLSVRSDRLCILVAGLLDAFVTALNLRRTHQETGLNFKELMYGRIKMMTALCPAWAHTYQTMCLGFLPGTTQT